MEVRTQQMLTSLLLEIRCTLLILLSTFNSLGSLADSMTDVKRENVRKICRGFLAKKLMFLNDEDVKWVLDYLSSGKAIIPYQMITNFDSLQIKPEEGFFKHGDFYSSLKEKDISLEEYENVKKFFTVFRLKTLGNLNRIYNFVRNF